MDLVYGYDWWKRRGKIASGAGPKPLWSREYAEAVLARREESILVSVFSSEQPPFVQIRLNPTAINFSVLWIDAQGDAELTFQFTEHIAGYNDDDFPDGSPTRDGEFFLRHVTRTSWNDDTKRGVDCNRAFRTDGSVRDSYTWHFSGRRPIGESVGWRVDPEVDTSLDGFWHPRIVELGPEDLEPLFERERVGVPTDFDIPTHPDDR